MAILRCEDVMTRHPRTCEPSETLLECIRTMKELNVGYVPICEATVGRLVGVVTDRDVAMALSHDESPSQLRIADVMTKDPIACRPEEDVFACARAMEDHKLRRIPVVDQNNILLGVIALADLARQSVQHKELELELGTVMEQVSQPG